MELTGVSEYCEGLPVDIAESTIGYGRLVLRAYNECGCSSTEVDLIELIEWIKANKPELLL